jgi:hypothetical protein
LIYREHGLTRAFGNGIAALRIAAVISISIAPFAAAAQTDDAVAKIVFIRHGEKPPAGLGQLDCQGLNRALALPPVIERMFGKPDTIFAPNPSGKSEDGGIAFDYVRPLATIEPTAIAFGLPVNASIKFSQRSALNAALEKALSKGKAKLILVAWEHKIISPAVKALLAAHGGDPAAVPDWRSDDFDSMYVVTLGANGSKASFAIQHEALDGLPTTCPK